MILNIDVHLLEWRRKGEIDLHGEIGSLVGI